MIRLVATDLDGTLLEPNGALPDGVFDIIRRLSAMGIRFAASSGRQHGNLRRLFGPVADEIAYVCENGAINIVNGETAGVVAIEEKEAREIIQDIKNAGMNLLISGRHTCYMLDENRHYTDDIVYRLRNTITILSSTDEITEPMLKISGQIDEGLDQIAPVLLEKWGSRLTATVSGRDWFDITAANKGMGMQLLMKHMGIKKEEVIAFGDNFNDETMLDGVRHPFIMAHANPKLLSKGYHTCRKVLPVLEALLEAKGDETQFYQLLRA